MRQKKHQEGMATLEGLILLILALFIMMFFLSFGFIFYQRWVVVHVANDTATRIAQTYAYPAADAVTGFISTDDKATTNPFRYFNDDLDNRNAQKAEDYAKWTLKLSTLAYKEKEPQITVKTVHDGLANRHVEVTIDAVYRIPFGEFLRVSSYWNYNNVIEYKYTGSAKVVDISDYINTVGTVKYLSDFDLGHSGETLDKLVKECHDLIQSFTNFWNSHRNTKENHQSNGQKG